MRPPTPRPAGRWSATPALLGLLLAVAVLAGSHLIDVLCRQGLWKKDVGFGVSYQTDSDHAIVLVNPGRSGLTARQRLDRLLGRG